MESQEIVSSVVSNVSSSSEIVRSKETEMSEIEKDTSLDENMVFGLTTISQLEAACEAMPDEIYEKFFRRVKARRARNAAQITPAAQKLFYHAKLHDVLTLIFTNKKVCNVRIVERNSERGRSSAVKLSIQDLATNEIIEMTPKIHGSLIEVCKVVTREQSAIKKD